MRFSRLLAVVASATVVALLGACAEFRQEKLELSLTPDCEASAQSKDFLGYWVAGQVPTPVNWSGCDKQGAQLAGTSLGTSNFTETNLSGANLEDADLGAALIRRSDLSEANLKDAILSAAFFEDVDLTGADLTGAHMTGGTYSNVDFSGATWTDGSTVCAEGSIDGCD